MDFLVLRTFLPASGSLISGTPAQTRKPELCLRGNISMLPLQLYTVANADFRRVEWCSDCGPLCAAGWGAQGRVGSNLWWLFFPPAGLFSAEHWRKKKIEIDF